MKLRIWMTEKQELECYNILGNGTDGCRVCFLPREYSEGPAAHQYDDCVVKIVNVFGEDDTNSSIRAFYHKNRGYAFADVVEFGENWIGTKS